MSRSLLYNNENHCAIHLKLYTLFNLHIDGPFKWFCLWWVTLAFWQTVIHGFLSYSSLLRLMYLD